MRVEPIREFEQFVDLQRVLVRDEKVKQCLLVQVMYHTNLRVSDALLIKWRDVIDEDGGIVDELYISEKKTSKRKWIPMTDQIKKSMLHFYHKYRPRKTEFIFRSESYRVQRRNQPWHRNYVYEFIRAYAKIAGIRERVGSHTPRKTWAYHAYQEGIDIYEISRMLNHSNIRVTEVYAGIDADRIRENYGEMSRLNAAADDLMNIETLPEHNFTYLRPRKKKRMRKKRVKLTNYVKRID